MNPDNNNRDLTREATQNAMDPLLAAHFTSGEELTPSSGFVLSVMESLQAETSAPQPIPFPWRRAVPGLIAVLFVMAAFGVFVLRQLRSIPASQHSLISPALWPQMHLSALEQALCWIAMATCLSIVTVAGCIRLATSNSKMRV